MSSKPQDSNFSFGMFEFTIARESRKTLVCPKEDSSEEDFEVLEFEEKSSENLKPVRKD